MSYWNLNPCYKKNQVALPRHNKWHVTFCKTKSTSTPEVDAWTQKSIEYNAQKYGECTKYFFCEICQTTQKYYHLNSLFNMRMKTDHLSIWFKYKAKVYLYLSGIHIYANKRIKIHPNNFKSGAIPFTCNRQVNNFNSGQQCRHISPFHWHISQRGS